LSIYAVVEQSTLSRTLDKLEADQNIRRETDSKDSRATRIFITADGLEVFDKIWPKMAKSYDSMFKGIPLSELSMFVATLQKLLQNVRHHDI
jgi:DNA-binding MarR family transcriptional regulator